MTRLRVRGAWLLALPLLWFARPTPETLGIGAIMAACGLLLRSISAGFIRKDRILTTTGPYAHTRHPLYLGSFVLGLGVSVAGGRWSFVLAFLVFFVAVYPATMRAESVRLRERFGAAWAEYADRVPAFVPRLRWSDGTSLRGTFSLAQWRKNREYEALLGTLAGFAVLTARMVLRG
ncbi:MAG: isoprenylcysteine carboxylmethyltransferase family protein [Longimicrobiales bacterium]|nr:isoprenylcysteine carboxylmethyltransferase family protein [Longimicrobiales bacterium]